MNILDDVGVSKLSVYSEMNYSFKVKKLLKFLMHVNLSQNKLYD